MLDDGKKLMMFEDLREGHWSRVWQGKGVSVGKGQSLRAVEAPAGFKQGIGIIRGVCVIKMTWTPVWRTDQEEARVDVGRTAKKVSQQSGESVGLKSSFGGETVGYTCTLRSYSPRGGDRNVYLEIV